MLTVNMAVSLGQQANLAHCGPVTLLAISDQRPGSLPWASMWWCHVLLSPSDFPPSGKLDPIAFPPGHSDAIRNSVGMWWGGGGCRAVFCWTHSVRTQSRGERASVPNRITFFYNIHNCCEAL